MSRHTIRGYNPGHGVVIGWDNPLQTYFAQVFESQSDPMADEKIVFQAGLFPGEVNTVEKLHDLLTPYAEIPTQTMYQLHHDRMQSQQPTPLQQRMQRLITDTLGEGYRP